MKIIWTIHAEERQREWERMKGVTREVVENVVLSPDQVVAGDLSTLVAQSQWRGGACCGSRLSRLGKDAS
jgi:hypothetical protein